MSAFRGLRYLSSDLDYRANESEERSDIFGTAEILLSRKQGISVGCPGDIIDQMGSYRQLLEATEFHAVGGALLKKLSPDEERDLAEDFSNLPSSLRAVLSAISSLGSRIDGSELFRVIRIARDNPEAIEWLEANCMEFVELPRDEEELKEKKFLPRDSYRVVERFRPNQYKEASAKRIRDLRATVRDISELRSLDDVERFLVRIRDPYREDGELLKEWSLVAKSNDRALYLQFLRKSGADLESIRRKTWAHFDRLPGVRVTNVQTVQPLVKQWFEKASQVSTWEELEDSTVPSVTVPIESMRIQPCTWDIERSKALCDLNQTRAQWKKVYDCLWKRAGLILLAAARAATTEVDRDRIRVALGHYQTKLDKATVRKIIDIFAKEQIAEEEALTCAEV